MMENNVQNYVELHQYNKSYDLDKNLTFKCDLYLGPTLTNVSNGTSTRNGEHLWLIILKSVHYCRSYGQIRTDGRTRAHTHIYRTVIVTAMSR